MRSARNILHTPHLNRGTTQLGKVSTASYQNGQFIVFKCVVPHLIFASRTTIRLNYPMSDGHLTEIGHAS